jgi:UDP-N-acetylmuramoyl-tripeptide--D-alanyl-D-alanine ligase
MTADWNRVTVRDILSPVRGHLTVGSDGRVLAGISTDSRTLAPGEVFWALKGDRFNGHDYLRAALDKGACGAVVARGEGSGFGNGTEPFIIEVNDTLEALGDLAAWWREEHGIPIAAITGSSGKTSTKEMTACVLELAASTLKTRGNFNNLIGLPLTLLQLTREHKHAVLEMGMNTPGEITRLTQIAGPQVGLITNVAKAHLEGLGSIQAVARAKLELAQEMSPAGSLVLFGDDPLLLSEASGLSRPFLTFGLGENNDYQAVNIENRGIDGIHFELKNEGSRRKIRLKTPGIQNVLNAAAASSVARLMGCSWETIEEGLYRFEGVSGRFTVVELSDGTILVDDTYNANPFSLRAALDSLNTLVSSEKRIIVGLGDMLELGRETIPAHRDAGRMTAEIGASHLLILGEYAAAVSEGAKERGMSDERILVVENHEEMALRIKEILNPGDLVFLKGSRRMGLERVSGMLGGQVKGEGHGRNEKNHSGG